MVLQTYSKQRIHGVKKFEIHIEHMDLNDFVVFLNGRRLQSSEYSISYKNKKAYGRIFKSGDPSAWTVVVERRTPKLSPIDSRAPLTSSGLEASLDRTTMMFQERKNGRFVDGTESMADFFVPKDGQVITADGTLVEQNLFFLVTESLDTSYINEKAGTLQLPRGRKKDLLLCYSFL